ncbi:putative iron-regulated membrane protein [Sphingobium subterraneum]|uniref:Putative iron-regulated membrane protein n=2 Tax=Sphingobium subterraneum TaxID=627688 RepID=A0A841IZL4_9SPHN|nr:putative iron-regulated membrane protein [Sphingobium subterraneum]
MSSQKTPPRGPVRRILVKGHKWLGIGAAVFWLIQALTGTLLSFHFEIDDALRSTRHVPTNYQAIEQRITAIDHSGPKADIVWIWATAGLPDRYVISHTDAQGADRRTWIDGSGAVLDSSGATDYSFLAFIREIHIDLLSGNTGQWIMAITGTFLVTNLIVGLVIAWPRKGHWMQALKPARTGGKTARTYSWHRAVGLWAVVPALLIAGTGTLILFEHGVRDIIGAPETELPPNPLRAERLIGWGTAAATAVAAIPGSRFVGGFMPSREDASYYVWLRAPGELYRGGYGSSLVVVDGNTGGVRGVFDSTKAEARQAFVTSFYPLHTGEAGGTLGRFLAMLIGIWLTTVTVLGLTLWLRRRPRRGARASAPTQRQAA